MKRTGGVDITVGPIPYEHVHTSDGRVESFDPRVHGYACGNPRCHDAPVLVLDDDVTPTVVVQNDLIAYLFADDPPMSDPDKSGPIEQEWEIEGGVTCVVCPGCAFTFDGYHTDQDGSYSCPTCGYGN